MQSFLFLSFLVYADVSAGGTAGTRSVGMMFRAVVFTFMPTAIELVLVCTLLAQRFKPAVALAVLATFVAYVAWTTVMTKVSNTILCNSQPLLSWLCGMDHRHDQGKQQRIVQLTTTAIMVMWHGPLS